MSFSRASVVLFALATVLVLITFTDYGVTWDEAFHVRYGAGVLQYIGSGFTDTDAYRYLDLYYYGAAFDLLCAVGVELSPLALYDTRHLLNAIVALVGVLGCFVLARELGTTRTAFLAALFLVLTPRWWGHGFNNPKDIPFAAGYVWSVYCLVRLMPQLPTVPNRLAIATGLAIGLTLGVRVGGLMLFGYLGIVMLLSLPRSLDAFKSLAIGFGKIAGVAWLVMLAFWPWAQSRPLTAPFEAFRVMSDFTWRGTVLFAGAEVHSTQIPSSYVPHWLAITLPEFLLLGAALAVWSALADGKRARFVLFTAVFPIAYIAISKPIIYDGMRHVLFIVPILCCLAARGYERLFEALAGWKRPALVLVALYGLYHVSILVRLHPNQVVYFNALVGGLSGAYGRYETDYWGNSYREAVGRLVETLEAESSSPPPYRVFVCSNPPTATAFFPHYLSRTRDEADADFLIGTTRWHCHRSMEGDELAVVERLGTPLNYVLDRRHLVAPRRRF